MFKRTQDELTADNSAKRQHNIPGHIHRFAVSQQLLNEGPSGRGRANLPTLADIYFQLTVEGLALVESGEVRPSFTEIGRPDGCRAAQIKFPNRINDKLIALKKRAEGGEFAVSPHREISLISVAVTLMEAAIWTRTHKPAVPIPINS